MESSSDTSSSDSDDSSDEDSSDEDSGDFSNDASNSSDIGNSLNVRLL